MADIVEFLTARYAEEAKRWQTIWRFKAGDSRIDGYWDLGGTLGRTVNAVIDTTHAGRDLAAKRRVLARHHPATGKELGWSSHIGACVGCGREGEFADPRTRVIDDCPELRDLAAPYADHPGYKQKWSVE